MAQKLWEKSVQVNKDIERFTVGRDREMDLYLVKHDVLGSMAHITMLESIGLLTKEELDQLLVELKSIYASVRKRRICDRRRGGRCTFTGRIDVDPSFGRYRKENT